MDYNSGQKLGHIQKKVETIDKGMVTGSFAEYHVDFGGVQNPNDKALLLAMAFAMDFRLFGNNLN